MVLEKDLNRSKKDIEGTEKWLEKPEKSLNGIKKGLPWQSMGKVFEYQSGKAMMD